MSNEEIIEILSKLISELQQDEDGLDESLDEDYNKQELINAVQSAYGYNKKEAKDYIKTIDDKTKEELIKGFKRDAEKSFLIDSLKEALYRFTTTQEDGTPGVEIVASSRDEAAKKLGILEKKRNNDRVRPLEEIDAIAMKLYKKHDDFSFHLFSDEELAMLFANTLVNPSKPYDDEVFEAISNFPNSKEIFDRAHKLADDFKNEGYSKKLGDSEKQLIESATKRKLVEEDDNSDSTNWLKVISKPIPDSDGFLTDYTMYRDLDDPEHYVFVFGDNELYGPEDSSNWDHEVFNGEEATEWYNDYNGIDDSDTVMDSEEIFDDEDPSFDDGEESDNTIGSYFSNYLDDEEDI